MQQSLGFVAYSSLVCQLKKSLHGLKKPPCAWYGKIDCFFVNVGFKRCEPDHKICVLHVHGDTLIV